MTAKLAKSEVSSKALERLNSLLVGRVNLAADPDLYCELSIWSAFVTYSKCVVGLSKTKPWASNPSDKMCKSANEAVERSLVKILGALAFPVCENSMFQLLVFEVLGIDGNFEPSDS